ncbi:MAG: hypothetical protein JWN03_5701 [Nocardia sp.]|uniref:hypothetical protein n=1 Tax=Nocardia sp. TaxID=1821 RepID=UPI00261CFD9B|nr:hypothetical protein [Nocardia sp.]MCU1645426.1 hypothetical protein [Nocardia sp.]
MAASVSARLMKMITVSLSERLAAEGFAPSVPPEGLTSAEPGKRYPRYRREWFASPEDSDTQLRRVVEAYMLRGNGGSVGLEGRARLMAEPVARMRAELSAEALESNAKARLLGCLESVQFGFFRHPSYPGQATVWISVEGDVDYGVNQIIDMMRGSVVQWFEQRASLAQLVELARMPNLTNPDRSNPDPARLRDVVILALSQGQAQEAVSLMEWYLQRDLFHKFDSLERATAFDAEMSVRFTEYARLRGGGSVS